MKNLIIVLLLMLSVSAFAQDKKKERKPDHKTDRVEMTADEMTTLRTKRMALQLDLTQAQQASLKSLFIAQATQRKALNAQNREMRKDTAAMRNNRFAMKNSRLDHQKEMQEKIRAILTPEQYETWKASADLQGKKMKKKHKKKNK